MVTKIAEKHNATGAQVVLAWSQTGGHSVIPKSVTPSRIAQNFQEIKISDEDVKAINEIGEKDPKRFNVPLTCKCQCCACLICPWAIAILLMKCRQTEVGHQHLGRRGREACDQCGGYQAIGLEITIVRPDGTTPGLP